MGIETVTSRGENGRFCLHCEMRVATMTVDMRQKLLLVEPEPCHAIQLIKGQDEVIVPDAVAGFMRWGRWGWPAADRV